jgi:primosomal protein N' (replication factor Y)
MDWDTTRGKNDFDRIINLFSSQKIKILVGTQMVVKGLDFKNVHLVGVINADHLINFPDFRSYERSFQMLTQVAGRSGRSDERGSVLIQTYQPFHPVIKNVIENNMKSFVESELKDRKLHLYPPFVRLVRITLKNRNIEILSIASDWFLNVLSQSYDGKILGPVFPPVSRVRNYYHKQLLVKLDSKISRLHFKKVLQKTKKSFESIASFKSTKFIIDVDPY